MDRGYTLSRRPTLMNSEDSRGKASQMLRRKFTETFASTGNMLRQSSVTPGDMSPGKRDEEEDDIDDGGGKPAGGEQDEGPLIEPPAHPILLSWQNINYGKEVDDEVLAAEMRKESCLPFLCRTPRMRRVLLNEVSGEARPGELMVILGPSGCGKTTLMNLLSGRLKLKKGAGDHGLIYVNGEKRNKRFKRHTAFVLQEDLFFDSMTVEQTLELTGRLLLRCDSEDQKAQRVQSMISLLRLEKCQHSRVGNAVRRGLSGGEKKRLNVANELLIDPALIFLDEPTSGLDAVLAEELLSILSMLAKSGRTVITTLHQPSSSIYGMVDKVYLMAEGGRVAYFGPAREAVPYFSRLGSRCPRYYNPADFLLEMVQNNPDLPDSYTPYQFIDETSKQLIVPPVRQQQQQSLKSADDEDSDDAGKKPGLYPDPSSLTSSSARGRTDSESQNSQAPLTTPAAEAAGGRVAGVPPPLPNMGEKWPIGWFEQCWLLGVRAFRHHVVIAVWNCFIFLMIAGIGSIVWWDRDFSFQSIADRQGLLFFILLQWFLFPMFGEVNILIPEIPIITKERREGMYRLSAYAAGKTLGELSLDIITPFLFTTVLYWTTNLNNDVARFFTAIFIILITYLVGQAIGFTVAAAIGSIELSSPILLVILFVTMLVSGFYASLDNIPGFFAVLQYVSPLRYEFDALMINEFAGEQVYRDKNDTITGNEILDDYDPVIWNGTWVCCWYNVCILVGMTIFFRIAGFLLLRRRTATAF